MPWDYGNPQIVTTILILVDDLMRWADHVIGEPGLLRADDSIGIQLHCIFHRMHHAPTKDRENKVFWQLKQGIPLNNFIA